MLPDWAVFPAELDYFLRRSGSGDDSIGVSIDVSTDISGDVSGDVSCALSIDVNILASTLLQFVRMKHILVHLYKLWDLSPPSFFHLETPFQF